MGKDIGVTMNCNQAGRGRSRAWHLAMTRRQFLGRTGAGVGAIALAALVDPKVLAAQAPTGHGLPGLPGLPHFPARAKRVIYLHQSGAPSQLDLYDPKPKLAALQGTELPDSIRMGQRITTMTSGQKTLPIAASMFKFAQHGQGGAWLSELLPHTAGVVDDLCFIKSMFTEAINHDPAITFFQTGSQQAGRPCVGSWVSYGLGSENADLPAFVVLISRGTGRPDDQPLYDRLWGAGFLPAQYQGVKFRSVGDPVLYLDNPAGITATTRRQMLDDLDEINNIHHETFGDPEIAARISQYEMAYKMQSSVPDLTDLSKEPQHILDMYGPNVHKAGTYAANCLLARRLCERGVRFVQLYHMGWDHHDKVPQRLRGQCSDTDQASAALITDLKQRGLLDDTLIVWGGEFGRTVYCQGPLAPDNYGRDHHPRSFTVWLSGGGIKGGISIGETDDFGYNIVKDPVHVHDLNATIMRCLGIDHKRLVFRYQGRDFRLTDVAGEVVSSILA